MIDKIILNEDFDLEETWIPEAETKRKLTRSHEVDVEGIKMKIKLKPDDFNDLKEKMIVETKEGFIPKERALEWIEDTIVGGINKDLLDQQRLKEINQLDLMQNTSIIYHTESILEMQFFCLIGCYYLQTQQEVKFEDSEEIMT